MLATYKYRRTKGASILETPGVIMLIFLGFCFPLIGLMTFSYRASLLWFSVRDAAYAAATQANFTSGMGPTGKQNAQDQAVATWNRDTASWTGITPAAGSPAITIIITANPAGTTTTSTTKLAKVDTSANIYFMQTTGTATIQPLLGTGWLLLFMNVSVPGLNAPYTVSMTQQVYVENPQSLLN
jgi:hypothetical protein